ncbi:hypothetical protein P170DRAFT_422603 [Aspergillus steynii IBT 23096]|uniref:PD-(D/E)XK nuclease-like domain-containing protein n=1 Tax=Aspergillus steynii IBT 23096 TaxID=1392250 RepID=A0A2I2GFJ5_9EURO|nr:uncharacterized protein P170DRAFT_422603 [Aspergillus steynii IBT 23096]PLB51607.1 hypothetical protein P170DRAFT_422603 [Aspergillus steynii IBT 23096]
MTQLARSLILLIAQAPDEAIDIPDAAFYDAANSTPEELYALWQDVTEIYNEAAEAEEHGQDENAWGSGVIQAVLQRGVKRRILQVKNVQTKNIDPCLLPRLPHKNAVSKKVDYTFAFSVRDPQVKETYNNFWNAFPDQTVSQTTDPFTKRVALFSGIEVKQSNGGNTEALVQLAIWLAAGLEKLSRLRDLHGEKSDRSSYQASDGQGCFEGQDRIYVDGPVESLSASTRTYYGIFKLINLVHKLSLYAEEVYWPWMKSDILTRTQS